ncbi:hypothetical protein HK098_006997 [Nowakowskiella sp. JEL0407]|nr:hypothetical protein HK098_006997 [Nowakowskiella sp. JEL0407]
MALSGIPTPASYHIHASLSQGRFCCASASLSPSSEVLRTFPYAFAIFDSFRKRVCAVCCAYNDLGVFPLRCSSCDQIYLCSSVCLYSLISSGHHLVCGGLKRVGGFKGNSHEKSVMKILVGVLFQRLVEVKGLTVTEIPDDVVLKDAVAVASGTTTMSYPAVQAPSFEYPESPVTLIPLFIPPQQTTTNFPVLHNNNTSANNSNNSSSYEISVTPTWSDFMQLESHYKDWPVTDVKDWRKTKLFLVKLLLGCGLFFESDLDGDDKTLPSIVGVTTTTDAIKMEKLGEFCLDLVSKIESNAFGLWNAKGGCMGRAIFPYAAYFNHSCDPNCESIQSKTSLTITTIRSVEKDEELTISYIDTNLPLHARRQRLLDDYYFTCRCTRCESESSGTGTTKKISYEKSYSKRKVKGAKNGKSLGVVGDAVVGKDEDDGALEEKLDEGVDSVRDCTEP